MKKAMISMKKAKRGVLSFAVIFAMLLSICSFTAMADSTDPTCYADVDEIVLTYQSAPGEVTPVLKKDGTVVSTTSTVNETDNTVVIKPATGNFERDVLYELTAGTFSQYFKIKTLIDGINKEDLSAYSGPNGGTGSAVVLIDSDNDGAEELFCVNHSSLHFINNSAAINTTENYTVKYDLSAYAYTTDKTNYTFLAKNYYNVIGHNMYFNATEAKTSTAPDGFQLYRSNYQSIKYFNGTSFTYDATTYPNTTDTNAGLSGLSDVYAGNGEEMGTPVKHGIVFYDQGTSPIEVLKTAGASVGVKLKKIGAAGTLYIDGNEKLTKSQGEATSGYFIFGGGEWGNNFISMENFVATTYEPVTVTEIKPVSYYGDTDAITVTFDNNVVSADNGTITVTQNGVEVQTDVAVNGNVVTLTPKSGVFKRDVASKITISSGFGSESSFTSKEYSKIFKIKTVQDTISEDTFGAASGNLWYLKKVYNDGKLYFYSYGLTPQHAHNTLENYTVTMKLTPYKITNAQINNLTDSNPYLEISFNNKTAGSHSNGNNPIWNLPNYTGGGYLYHQEYDTSQGKYVSKWTSYGTFANMGMPTSDAKLKTINTTETEPYIAFAANDTAEGVSPATFKITKNGNSGTLKAGSVTDTITTGSNTTGYFTLRSSAFHSVIELSEFIMTTFEVEDVSLSNATATKDANSVTLTYDINKGGDNASYPVWIVAAAYGSSHRLLGAAISTTTALTQSVTGDSITISGIDTSKISEIKIFTWDTSSSIKPYGAPTPVSIPTN